MVVSFLEEIKTILKSLVLSCPGTITIEKLNKDFRDVEGHWIPYEKLGYCNLESFLQSLTDTLVIKGHGKLAQVGFVSNEKSQHIDQLVSGQKNNSGRRKKPASKKRQNHHPPEFYYSSAYPRYKPIYAMNSMLDDFSNMRVSGRTDENERTGTRTPNRNPKNLITTSYENQRSGISTHNESQRTSTRMPDSTNPKNMIRTSYENQRSGIRTHDESQRTGTITPDRNTKNLIRTTYENQRNGKETSNENQRSDLRTKYEVFSYQNISVNFRNNQESSSISSNNLSNYYEESKSPDNAIRKSEFDLSEQNTYDYITNKIKLKSKSDNTKQSMQAKVEANKTLAKYDNRYNSGIKKNHINDINEAVPEFAADRSVMVVGYPKNAAIFGDKIKPYEFPSYFEKGAIIGIFITEVQSPFKFFFHIYQESGELDCLMNRMDNFYTNLDEDEFDIPLPCIVPGQICAVFFNRIWNRAEILLRACNNKAKVYFVDYGTVCDISTNQMKYLPLHLANIQAQTYRGSLSFIKAPNVNFTTKETNVFISMISERLLYAEITVIDVSNRVTHMVLCDTNSDPYIQINKVLVQKKVALYDDIWDDKRTYALFERGC